MKTLYINISGKSIQNSEDIIVVGTPDDAIVDKFYYELGKEIVKGVDAPGIRGLAKHIVKSYKDIDEKAFGKITEQWLKVKDKLLGEDPTGSETIELPMEYVKWLQNYGDASHTEIAKSLYARNCLVEISLDKIYRNSVNIIINSIEPDNYGQFVVNDEIVTDDSAISIAIMKKFDGIAFKPYKKEDVCPNCGKNPCECPNACPKCGKNPCECHIEIDWTKLFPVEKVTLGLTNIFDIILDKRKCFCAPFGYQYYIQNSERNLGFIQGYMDNAIIVVSAYSGGPYHKNTWLPKRWEALLGISSNFNTLQVKSSLKQRGVLDGPWELEDALCYVTPDENYLLLIYFTDNIIDALSVFAFACPHCGSHELELKGDVNSGISIRCLKCHHQWGTMLFCPNCSSNNFECGSDHFQCNDCGFSREI